MKVLRVMVALFVLAMVAGVSAQVMNDLYMIPKTTVAPIIDGDLDAVWTNVMEVPQNYICTGDVIDSHADLWGFSRVMWDDNNLYMFLRTQDDINWTTNANSYEDDSWEIYFDGDNSKGTSYDNVNDMQLRFGIPNDVVVADLDGQTYWDRLGTEFVSKLADDGTGNSTLEIKFPIAQLFIDPSAETEFGFQLQQNDADGGTTAREARTKWWWNDETDVSWNNPSKFGTAMLWKREVGDVADFHQTRVIPVIDGVQDDVWKEQPVFSQNFHCNGDVWDDDLDLSGSFQAMWDADNLYMLLNTVDDINWTTNANSYEDDSWEIYFDGDNSKGTAYDNVNDMQLRFGIPNDVVAADLDGQTLWIRDGLEFVSKMADDGTGNSTLEIKFPIANLFIDPSIGTEFGFQAQQNDADGGTTAREARTKWWNDAPDVAWNNPSVFGTAMLAGDIAGAVNARPGVAKNYSLSQNYPNPFNPTTSIDFSVTHRGAVKLAVYDLTGKLVADLVNETKSAGNYSATFDASNLPSGVYFYKLEADSKVSTKKMMLLK